MKKISVTYIMPCLNEEISLDKFLTECKDVLNSTEFDWKIAVVDNGSTDRSLEIARSHGVEIINEVVRGYGSAVHRGVTTCKTEYLIFSDADGTYDPRDGVSLLRLAIENDLDLAIGSRIKGQIDEGAMPFWNRYLGTPFLTLFIRVFYNLKITDCNCGIRCFKTNSIQSWELKYKGMEYASEQLIKASKNKARIMEIPVRLRRDNKGRQPHLRPIRDGLRHLFIIFKELLSCR